MEIDQECEMHAETGEHGVPAVGHCQYEPYSRYWLCQDCIDEIDGPYFSIETHPKLETITVEFEARLTPQGNSLGVRVPSERLDEIGVGRGDRIHVTIRRVK